MFIILCRFVNSKPFLSQTTEGNSNSFGNKRIWYYSCSLCFNLCVDAKLKFQWNANFIFHEIVFINDNLSNLLFSIRNLKTLRAKTVNQKLKHNMRAQDVDTVQVSLRYKWNKYKPYLHKNTFQFGVSGIHVPSYPRFRWGSGHAFISPIAVHYMPKVILFQT